MTKSILITGSSGQVGHELSIAVSQHRLIPLSRQQLEITDPLQIEAAIENHCPDIMINAAAYTQVDRAEQEQSQAFAINRDGVADLAYACIKADIPLLHISTNYVFDGSIQGAYEEDGPIAPLGIYGKSKASGEAILRTVLEKHIILRTSWVFSVTGNNFVKTMLHLGKERDQLEIVNDQRGCPTSARSITQVLLNIADQYLSGAGVKWGTYHYCNQPETTWFEYAKEIFHQAGDYEKLRLRPITTNEYPTPAQRPKNSVLDCAKIEKEFGTQQASWIEELKPLV